MSFIYVIKYFSDMTGYTAPDCTKVLRQKGIHYENFSPRSSSTCPMGSKNWQKMDTYW